MMKDGVQFRAGPKQRRFRHNIPWLSSVPRYSSALPFVSLELSSVCVVDAKAEIIREAKIGSEPDALIDFLRGLGVPIERAGLEAGPLSQWLHAGLTGSGFDAVLLETRHVKAALSAMTVKTDRKDARGIAQLLRMGWFRPVHCKSIGSQEVRVLLVARKLLRARGEVVDDDLLAHVAPLGWEHITFNGDYIWPTEPLEYGFRPLRDPRSAFLDAA